MTEVNCCSKPSLLPAWSPHWPFRAVYCQNCDEVTMICSDFWTWVWQYIYAPLFPDRVGEVWVEDRRWTAYMAETKLGGFQSGFKTQMVPRAQAKWPQLLVCRCEPPCETVVQLVSAVSGKVEFELCRAEAEKMGRVLIEAARRQES